jgi:hypothetical protein
LRIYLTHCSAKKDPTLRGTHRKVGPDELYTSTKLQGFISKCREAKVKWAIFSDKYGVWFPNELHEWYEKDPDTVTEEEFKNLLRDFEAKLGGVDEIYFYYNPGRFHPLYRRLLSEVRVKARIVKFTHKNEIT